MATDFKAWDRATLEKFARQAADENRILASDLKMMHGAWRALVWEFYTKTHTRGDAIKPRRGHK